ncbi:hypothetical protein DSO57_1018631 [Entomophthora muscae]|uniref:Uncharacterized protein n=2 Tax=Entomophthora muscae TaxID=34485 RepID=A0ACC2TRF9_9FUNG|nr:hypothetical protein DSO57_1018631 [Entomophthora muscae]
MAGTTFEYFITGPALSQLTTDSLISGEDGMEGLLLGSFNENKTTSINDITDSTTSAIQVSCTIKGHVPFSLKQRLTIIDPNGRLDESQLADIPLAGMSILGCFSTRPRAAEFPLCPSTRTLNFAKHVATVTKAQISGLAMILSCNGGSHSTKQAQFRTFATNTSSGWESVSLNVLSLSIRSAVDTPSSTNPASLANILAPRSEPSQTVPMLNIEHLTFQHNSLFNSATQELNDALDSICSNNN